MKITKQSAREFDILKGALLWSRYGESFLVLMQGAFFFVAFVLDSF